MSQPQKIFNSNVSVTLEIYIYTNDGIHLSRIRMKKCDVKKKRDTHQIHTKGQHMTRVTANCCLMWLPLASSVSLKARRLDREPEAPVTCWVFTLLVQMLWTTTSLGLAG